MSDDPGAPRQTFLKIVRHVRRDRRISGSLKGGSETVPFGTISKRGALFLQKGTV